IDTLSLEGARYLKGKEWNASLGDLKRLLAHRELLVRALAYTKLDPADPVQRKILEDVKSVEPNAALREQVELKLAESSGEITLREPAPKKDSKDDLEPFEFPDNDAQFMP